MRREGDLAARIDANNIRVRPIAFAIGEPTKAATERKIDQSIRLTLPLIAVPERRRKIRNVVSNDRIVAHLPPGRELESAPVLRVEEVKIKSGAASNLSRPSNVASNNNCTNDIQNVQA